MSSNILCSILVVLFLAVPAAAEWEIIHISSPGPGMALTGIDLGDGNNDGVNELYAAALPQMVSGYEGNRPAFIQSMP